MQAAEHIKSINYAIEYPDMDKVSTLMNAVKFMQKRHTPPAIQSAKTFPKIDDYWLDGFIDTINFDVEEFTRNIDKITSPSKYVKKLRLTNDCFKAIADIMAAPRVDKDELDPDTYKKWKALYAANFNGGLDKIKKLLDSLTGKNGVTMIKDGLKYISLIILVIGTLLRNYLICVIALGLIATDVYLDKYIKESILCDGDSILDNKNYPYVLSGSYPLLHVSRDKELMEINTNTNEAFLANNLVDLITKVNTYMVTKWEPSIRGAYCSAERRRFPHKEIYVLLDRTYFTRTAEHHSTSR